jgi:hypothetical protein
MRLLFAFGCVTWFASIISPSAFAAPNVTNISLRGLQIGGTTTVVIEGSELLPNPVLIASFPIANQTVKPNAQANRVEIEIAVPPGWRTIQPIQSPGSLAVEFHRPSRHVLRTGRNGHATRAI